MFYNIKFTIEKINSANLTGDLSIPKINHLKSARADAWY